MAGSIQAYRAAVAVVLGEAAAASNYGKGDPETLDALDRDRYVDAILAELTVDVLLDWLFLNGYRKPGERLERVTRITSIKDSEIRLLRVELAKARGLVIAAQQTNRLFWTVVDDFDLPEAMKGKLEPLRLKVTRE